MSEVIQVEWGGEVEVVAIAGLTRQTPHALFHLLTSSEKHWNPLCAKANTINSQSALQVLQQKVDKSLIVSQKGSEILVQVSGKTRLVFTNVPADYLSH